MKKTKKFIAIEYIVSDEWHKKNFKNKGDAVNYYNQLITQTKRIIIK